MRWQEKCNHFTNNFFHQSLIMMLQGNGTNTFHIAIAGTNHEQLPVGFYTIVIPPMGNPMLNQLELPITIQMTPLSVGEKSVAVTTRYYEQTENNFGIMLSGSSGMGKTRSVQAIAKELNLPVIIITQPLSLDILMFVLDNVGTDVILFFDEFEKIYKNQEDSEKLLTLFDGLKTKNRVLFAICFNEVRNVSSYFFNRPGRVIFHWEFHPLTIAFAMTFIKDHVKQTELSDAFWNRIDTYLESIDTISFDILDKIVKIIDMFGEDSSDFLNSLNIEYVSYKYVIDLEFTMSNTYKTINLASHEIQSLVENTDENDEYFTSDFELIETEEEFNAHKEYSNYRRSVQKIQIKETTMYRSVVRIYTYYETLRDLVIIKASDVDVSFILNDIDVNLNNELISHREYLQKKLSSSNKLNFKKIKNYSARTSYVTNMF